MNNTYNAYAPDVLKAESFTDVLANVANDWMPQDPSNTWGGSFMVGGDWNFSAREQEHNGVSQGQTCLPDTSSNNSAEKAKGGQVRLAVAILLDTFISAIVAAETMH